MGATTVSRRASGQLTPERLYVWHRDQLEEMAREGGTDSYCGNWNSNHHGLHLVEGKFTAETAKAYADKHLEKRGAILAFRIGDFSQVWPVTKAQQDIRDRLAKLDAEYNEFEYRILERAQKQSSKTKKCTHCESSINVHKIHKPDVKELKQDCGRFMGSGLTFEFGRYMLANTFGLTDCPVCGHNLLKTDTDTKNHESLKTRFMEARKKEVQSRDEFAKSQVGKPEAYWFVTGECAC